jgi:hypothetical protein
LERRENGRRMKGKEREMIRIEEERVGKGCRWGIKLKGGNEWGKKRREEYKEEVWKGGVGRGWERGKLRIEREGEVNKREVGKR